jgi:acid stress-induced BolA-like protein IbaG/YrbA
MLENEVIEQLFKDIDGMQFVKVEGDGHTYQLTLVTDLFKGKSKVARQQWTYAILKEYIVSGTLHAITMYTWTIDEWESQNG